MPDNPKDAPAPRGGRDRPRDAEPEKKPLPPAAFARQVVIALALVTLALFLWKIAPVLMLFFAGVVLATAIHAGSLPLVRRLHVPPTIAVGIVFALLILAIVGGGYLFGKQVATQAEAFVEAIGQAWEKLEAYLQSTPLGGTVLESVKSTGDPEAMKRIAKGTVTVFGAFTDLILVLFLSMYLAVNPVSYRNGFLLLFPPPHRARLGEALDASGIALRKWLVGQLGAMTMVGVATAAGLWAVGVPLAIPLGILSGLLDFVPVIGPFAAAIPGILIAFAQGPQVALYAALVYITVQFLEGHVVLPLAQKWAVSLPPALGLLSIVAFGLVFGLMGVLFAIPLTVVVVVLVQKLYVAQIGGDETPLQRKTRPPRE
ncbi:MAG TPA: AI-2E family transporter [Usitatibacter sp.]|nr:AI-2E family transporter [Usitatibacter sp.]